MKRHSLDPIVVSLEIGKKKTFASALNWPGWCRHGRDEESSLGALFTYGPRYARVLRTAGIEFYIPADASMFKVVEWLEGNATTDFGAPGISPSSDARPVDDTDLHFLVTVLEACWKAFDNTVQASADKELSKGPRGGGRDLPGITMHVMNAEGAYLSKIGGRFKQAEDEDPVRELRRMRKIILETLGAAALGELPSHGPRGGIYWTPRYFIRRDTWHILDHTWEIEDRTI